MPDRLDDAIEIGQYVIIPEAKDANFVVSQPRVARHVFLPLPPKTVTIAIEFDGNPKLGTKEI